MTTEEAIRKFEIFCNATKKVLDSNENHYLKDFESFYREKIEMAELALSALRNKQKNNAPLTLDELREMDGEPVWIVWIDGRIESKWWIVGNYDWNMMEFFDTPMLGQCGKTWIAYRRKPEDDATK